MHARFYSLSLSVALALGNFLLLGVPFAAQASYLPGETLNPSCLPTDSTCVVTSLTASSTATSFPYYAANGSVLSATSTLTLLTNGNFGIGTTSPYAKLSVVGETVSNYFTATSTTATSTFANHISIASGKSYRINGVPVVRIATSGSGDSIFVGQNAGSGATGYQNTFVGPQAGYSNTTGWNNTAIGYQSLYSNTTGINSTAIGNSALYNTTGINNTATGYNALYSNTTGVDNTAAGNNVLYYNLSATSTVAIGNSAGKGEGSGGYSNQGGTYIGYKSGYKVSTGSDYNTMLGYQSGYEVTTGANNILLGYKAGYSGTNLTTGSNNIIIGYDIGATSTNMTRGLNIGNLIFGINIDGTGTTLSSGNIGIGTTSPYAKLSVVGETVSSYFTATSTTATSTFANNISIASGAEYRIGGVRMVAGYSGAGASFGYSNTQSSTGVTFGNGNTANNTNASSFGVSNISNGISSVAFGLSNTASANTSNAFGGTNTASGVSSSAFGSINSATTTNALAVGFTNKAGGGIGSVAVGVSNNAWGSSAIALGISNTVNGGSGIAVGDSNSVVDDSYAFGGALTVSNSAMAFGYGITNSTAGSLMIGPSNTAKLTILSSGNVGIGTSTPYARLTVWGTDTASTSPFTVANSASTTVFAVYNNGNATYSGLIFQSSDQRLKTNITSLDASASLDAILGLTPVSYTRLDQSDLGTNLGFIAQDVQQIFPNLVSTSSPTALTPDGTLTLNYVGLIAPLVEALKALAGEVRDFARSITTAVVNATTVNSQQNNTQKLCVGSTCITEPELKAILQNNNQTIISPPAINDAGADSSAAVSDNSATSTDATSTPQADTTDVAATSISPTSDTDPSATDTNPPLTNTSSSSSDTSSPPADSSTSSTTASG